MRAGSSSAEPFLSGKKQGHKDNLLGLDRFRSSAWRGGGQKVWYALRSSGNTKLSRDIPPKVGERPKNVWQWNMYVQLLVLSLNQPRKSKTSRSRHRAVQPAVGQNRDKPCTMPVAGGCLQDASSTKSFREASESLSRLQLELTTARLRLVLHPSEWMYVDQGTH